jgi:hypothetical protein
MNAYAGRFQAGCRSTDFVACCRSERCRFCETKGVAGTLEGVVGSRFRIRMKAVGANHDNGGGRLHRQKAHGVR